MKIGWTSKPIEVRLREFDTTSIPLPFQCVYAARVANARFVESQLHNAFSDHRVRSSREFFRIAPERVVAALRIAEIIEDVSPVEDVVESAEDGKALDQAQERRANFNFAVVKIPIGTILQFTRDSEITCQVVSDRRVKFQEEVMSTSLAAQKAFALKNVQWKAVQGPLYWNYNGKTLDEWRSEIAENNIEST